MLGKRGRLASYHRRCITLGNPALVLITQNILMSNPKGLIADIVIAGGEFRLDLSFPIAISLYTHTSGGTAGCAVAGRLSDAFPDLSIVIVENGPESRHNPLVDRKLQVICCPKPKPIYRSAAGRVPGLPAAGDKYVAALSSWRFADPQSSTIRRCRMST